MNQRPPQRQPLRRPSSPPSRRPAREVAKRRPWWRRRKALWLLLPGALGVFGAIVLFFYFFAAVPLPSSIGQDSTVVLDRNGEQVAELARQVSRTDVPLASLPEHVRQAVLAAEDANFYEHSGVSLPGIFRAAVRNVLSGRVAQGGSTISQQYIKTVTEQNERTALRKVREAALAVKLERQFSKDEILEFYLNSIYFGRGANGIEAAARAYFGIGAAQLDVAQAAQLAAVIPAPSALDPSKNPEGARRRYEYVLERMLANDWLSAGEQQRLLAAPPTVQARQPVQFRTAPFFLDIVQRELANRLGEDQVYRGLTVTTTLDLKMQAVAEREFAKALANAEDEATAAMVSLDPETGGIRALVNGRPGEQINFVADAHRQPGSTFKPFGLAAWVESGKSPESRFEGPAKMTFPDGRGQEPYEVNNYGGQAYGLITLREASWKSVNTVFAQVTDEVKPKAVVDIAKRAGIDSALEANLSLVLGTNEVTPLELAAAYNTFAAGGMRRQPFSVVKVERDGELLFQARTREDRAFSEQVAYTVTDVLQGVLQSGTGRRAAIGRPAAGKTGTTQRYADAWFAGYTPDLTTVVWYGQRDGNNGLAGRPTGGSWPAGLWGAYMREALKGVDAHAFPKPSGSLQVVGPTPQPTEEEPSPCPEGSVRVTAEGEDGDQADPLQQVCAPSPSESAEPSESASPLPTPSVPTGEPSPAPTVTASPTPAEPTPTPTAT